MIWMLMMGILPVAVLCSVRIKTGRAEDFSLGDYARETNPELKKQQVIYYPNASSCGTETAIWISSPMQTLACCGGN